MERNTMFEDVFRRETKLRVRFSMKNLKLNGTILNIPLFLADYADKLIRLALF